MGTQNQEPTGQPKPTAPGKPPTPVSQRRGKRGRTSRRPDATHRSRSRAMNVIGSRVPALKAINSSSDRQGSPLRRISSMFAPASLHLGRKQPSQLCESTSFSAGASPPTRPRERTHDVQRCRDGNSAFWITIPAVRCQRVTVRFPRSVSCGQALPAVSSLNANLSLMWVLKKAPLANALRRPLCISGGTSKYL